MKVDPLKLLPGLLLSLVSAVSAVDAAESLVVASDFEGASVSGLEIDNTTRTIKFMPGGDPVRRWPCWWYFRIDGITPGETITLHLRGSTATVAKPGSPLQRPLGSSWAMPAQATFSTDGKKWLHSEKGQRHDERMIYTIQPDSASMFVAWGPPYTPSDAAKFVRANQSHQAADSDE